MNIILYSRVSTDKQEIAQQERTALEWLSARSLEPTSVISEEGVSGGVSYRERKLGKEVLPMLSEGDILIVSEISRLGRSMSDLNLLVNEELKPRGVRLVIVSMGIDLDCSHIRAIDEMLLFSFSFAAQIEKELIQERTKSALEVRKKQIREQGGFTSKKGNKCTKLGNAKGCDMTSAHSASAAKRTAEAKEKNRILWVAISSLEGMSCTVAAERLNELKMTTPTGLPFTADRYKTVKKNLSRLMAN